MKFFSFFFLLTVAIAKNILLSNDDGWAATNVRAAYRDLKEAGHNVVMVAPVSQRSGWGGRFQVPGNTDKLETNGEFDYRVKGDPAWGHEEDDMNLWYFNGTPSACVAFGLDYVIPKYFGNMSIDLIVNGPNEGTNVGPMLYTLSGTMSATYFGVYRGYPAIAFSGSNNNNSFFKDSLDKDPLNPANINANVTVELVEQIFDAQGVNSRALPIGVGLNVNIPHVGYDAEDDTCNAPKFVYTRMNGLDSDADKIVFNETSGLVEVSYDFYPEALTVCSAGDCTLPSEALVMDRWNCSTAVSAFSVDYDANINLQNQVKGILNPIF